MHPEMYILTPSLILKYLAILSILMKIIQKKNDCSISLYEYSMRSLLTMFAFDIRACNTIASF